MPTYTCEKCARVFKQKSGYTDHMSKKNDCAKNTVIHAIVEAKVEEKIQDVVRRVIPKPEIMDKAQFQSFFEDLHNLLWNKAGLNPEKALEHMTFFFAYRLIEQQADALHLPNECRWSYIANIRNEQDLFDAVKRGVSSFRTNPKTKPFFKPHEIQKCETVAEIIQQINRISLATLQQTDTLGDIFEYMLGRGMSTMSDEGQYFTDRQICKLAFKLAYQIKQTLRRSDGSLCTFGDWFCGTGGFPAEYVKGVKSHLPDICWERECGSIYCQDMNTSSVTTTLLNMLILTGIPFNDRNIRSANSFTDAIIMGAGAPFPDLTLDYCFMNPPYGGDKTKGKEYKFTYSKMVKGDDGTKTKRFYVNREIQSIGIEDDDKVSAGVQLGMATLSSEGGVCCLVLPQGFFFGASKKCVELRQKLAEEYKIWYVVDIASGSFLNTGTKTSMIVFQKGVGATETVSFIGLDETVLVTATLEELRTKNYSLNYKQYIAQNVVEVEGFEMVKLGDISKITFGYGIKSSDFGTMGMPIIKTKNFKKTEVVLLENNPRTTTKYREEYLVKKGDLLVVIDGACGDFGLWNDEDGWLNQHVAKIEFENEITKRFVFYSLFTHTYRTYIQSESVSTTIAHMPRDTIKNYRIPFPPLERQEQIVESIDGFTQLAHHEEQALKMLEKQVMFFVKEMGRGQPRVKLGEVCEFTRGKMITKKELVDGEFPVIGGGLSPMGYHISSNRNAYTCLISQSGENAGHVSRYDKPVWASDCFSASSSKMSDDFLYYSLLLIQNDINFLKTGTAQPHIYPSSIDSLMIPLPPLVEQQTLQSEFEEIRHKHAKIAEYKKRAQDAIQRLIPGA